MKNFAKVVLGIAVLFFYCAHQIPPGGGPDDKIPPKINSSYPIRGSVGIPTTASIMLNFSEWVVPQNPEKSISMYPPAPGGIKISISGKKLVIKPKKPLADSTTYHVMINTALADLHGNSIGIPYDLFFSTGPTIDSGRIFGCVTLPSAKKGQPKIGLFPSVKIDSSDTNFFGPPSYVAQTDSAGLFSFDNIHRGTYDCIAFFDDNNDNRFSPGVEQAFAAIDKRIKLDKTAGPLTLFPVNCDTTTMRISKITPLSAKHLLCEWTGGIGISSNGFDSLWKVESVDGKRSLAIKTYIPVYNTRRFFLVVADTLGLQPFRLVCSKKSPLFLRKNATQRDTIRFNGVSQSDTTTPLLRSKEPLVLADLKPIIKLAWSKPMFPQFSKWQCADSLKDTVGLTVSQSLADTTIIRVNRPLKTGDKYDIVFPDSLFKDICGNPPKDSLGIKMSFTTLDDKDLCYSLSGGASCMKPDSKRKWIFTTIVGSRKYLVSDNAGQFRYDSLCAGKGTMTIFSDVNNDGELNVGSLVPWVPSEPYFLPPDTVEARKNWDIEGVSITGACEDCFRPRTLIIPSDTATHKP